MTAEELLAAMRADGAEKPIKVESKRWGTVYVRPPNVAEFDRMRKHMSQDRDEEDGPDRARIAAHIICDENGKRLLDPENQEHLTVLAARRGEDLTDLINAALGDGPGN